VTATRDCCSHPVREDVSSGIHICLYHQLIGENVLISINRQASFGLISMFNLAAVNSPLCRSSLADSYSLIHIPLKYLSKNSSIATQTTKLMCVVKVVDA